MATTAIATYTQFQAFAPTLLVDQTTIDPLLSRAHVWSQAAIADVVSVIEERVQDAECQYTLCLLRELPVDSGVVKGELKLKKVGHTEEEYYPSSEGLDEGLKTIGDCYDLAWRFLYLAGLEQSSFCAGVVR